MTTHPEDLIASSSKLLDGMDNIVLALSKHERG